MSIATLSKALAAKHDIPIDMARDMVVDVLQLIEDSAVANGRCSVRGFGVFKMQRFAEKPARNPKTGERVIAPARTRLVFKHSVDRRDAVSDIEPSLPHVDTNQLQLSLG